MEAVFYPFCMFKLAPFSTKCPFTSMTATLHPCLCYIHIVPLKEFFFTQVLGSFFNLTLTLFSIENTFTVPLRPSQLYSELCLSYSNPLLKQNAPLRSLEQYYTLCLSCSDPLLHDNFPLCYGSPIFHPFYVLH